MAEDGYQQSIQLSAARERVWDAVGTLSGPRQWWTTTVTGSADEGGELRFGFAGLPEEMTMLVVTSHRPASVTWRCVAHSRDQEWTGTELSFALADCEPGRCELAFRHTGLPGDLVADGWRHFLASLTAYAEDGTGHPFGAET
ncbi:MAG: SRPBCC domain-containing protein [Actinomycetota bacterium]|nr:SRPBCC domain-containing protein [Actinomycetota bacterium]